MFLAVLDETNRFSGTYDAIPTGRFRLVETLVGNFEQRVIVSSVARAASDTDADRHAACVASVRIRNPPTHALAQRQGVVSIDAVGNNYELFSAKTVSEIGHPRCRHDVQNNSFEHLVPGGMAEAIVVC